MQRLEVSGAVRPLYGSLGVKGLISFFAVMWFTYCLNDSEFVPVAPIITGIAFVFKFHIHCTSNVIISHFKLFFRLIITVILFSLHVCIVLLFFCYSA